MKTRFLIGVLLGGAAVLSAQAATLRLVSPVQVCAAARELLAAAADRQGVQATVECPKARATEAAPGALGWALGSESQPLIAGPSRVVLQMTVDGQRSRAVGVPIVLTLRSKAWVATQAVLAGELLGARNVEAREIQWPVGVTPAAGNETPPNGRTRLALKPGDVVTAEHLMPPGQKLQGDAVKVAVRSGAITLEMPAVLASNAQIGRTARVQLKGRPDTLEGVLVDASTVIVER